MSVVNLHPHKFGPVPNIDKIPQYLRDHCLWCVWYAKPKKNNPTKFDKVPTNRVEYRLNKDSGVEELVGIPSTQPEMWLSFGQAMALYNGNPGVFNGVGVLVNQAAGLTYIDVDDEVLGSIDSWITGWPTYIERSPSGVGLRIISAGQVSRDITEPVEVYCGNTPRFVTITGDVIREEPIVDLSQSIEQNILPLHVAKADVVPIIEMPEMTPYPPNTPHITFDTSDRSSEMLKIGLAHLHSGLTAGQVLQLMWDSPEVWEYCSDHRNIEEKYLPFLWTNNLMLSVQRYEQDKGSDDPTQVFDTIARTGPPPAAAKRGLKIKRMSEVTAVPIRWMWEGFLVDHKLNLIAGDPGVSKSLLTVMLAAHVSRGTQWPDGHVCKPGTTILFSAEDADDDTVVPRLIAAGADLEKVVSIDSTADAESGDDERLFNLQNDVELLKEAIVTLGDVRLLCIDPLNAYLGSDTNTNRDNEIRQILMPLVKLAEEYGVCIVAISHLNKDMNKDAIYRIMGSMGTVALSRVVWGIVKDRETPERRLITNIKANLVKDTEGLAYRVKSKPVAEVEGQLNPYIEFETERHSITAADAMQVQGNERAAPARHEAEDLIVELLTPGPMTSHELESAVVQEHSSATYRRARSEVGVLSELKHDTNVWWSALPKDGTMLSERSGAALEQRRTGAGQNASVPYFLQ